MILADRLDRRNTRSQLLMVIARHLEAESAIVSCDDEKSLLKLLRRRQGCTAGRVDVFEEPLEVVFDSFVSNSVVELHSSAYRTAASRQHQLRQRHLLSHTTICRLGALNDTAVHRQCFWRLGLVSHKFSNHKQSVGTSKERSKFWFKSCYDELLHCIGVEVMRKAC